MIPYLLYLLIFLCLIYFTGFFGLFDDALVSRKKFTLLFLGKAAAVPVFLFVYTKLYGGIADLDTGKFYHDAKIISDYGGAHPGFFIRLMLGLQNDGTNSADFINCLQYTVNWDNGVIKDYLYNDNRVVIRLHALLHFIAFNSFMAQALFNCFLSFVGILFIYRAFKEWFAGKEFILLLILCFWPALWFYTGAVLKEGITLCVMGCTIYQLKTIDTHPTVKRSAGLLLLLFLSFLLKPYVLIFSAFCFFLFFTLDRRNLKLKPTCFFGLMLGLTLLVNLGSLAFKNRSLLSAATEQQRKFVRVSKGGVFVTDSLKLVRLQDTTQIKKIPGTKERYTIKKNAPYIYFQTHELNDTHRVVSNADTTTRYQLLYVITPGNSNVTLAQEGPVGTLVSCLYYTLFYPDFLHAKTIVQFLAAAENIFIVLSLAIIAFGLLKNRREKFLPLVFLFFCFSLCLLIGFTSPNSGAIFRYRSPAVIFLLMAALYYLWPQRFFKIKALL